MDKITIVATEKQTVVHTASIDVKIIRLEKKQMTLSVFRQLKEKNIFDQDNDDVVSTLGQPWGRVNYVWNGCPKWATFHLVWCLNGELYRMPCPSTGDCFYEEKPTYRGDIDTTFLCVSGFFSWISDDYHPQHEGEWNHDKGDDKEIDSILESYVDFLRGFESMQQLFIAV